MPRLRLFQTYDLVAQSIIGPIIITANEGAALRIFTDSLKNPDSLGKHPEDYQMREIGKIDPDTGELTPCEVRTLALTGKAWAQQQNTEGQNRMEAR